MENEPADPGGGDVTSSNTNPQLVVETRKPADALYDRAIRAEFRQKGAARKVKIEPFIEALNKMLTESEMKTIDLFPSRNAWFIFFKNIDLIESLSRSGTTVSDYRVDFEDASIEHIDVSFSDDTNLKYHEYFKKSNDKFGT